MQSLRVNRNDVHAVRDGDYDYYQRGNNRNIIEGKPEITKSSYSAKDCEGRMSQNANTKCGRSESITNC